MTFIRLFVLVYLKFILFNAFEFNRLLLRQGNEKIKKLLLNTVHEGDENHVCFLLLFY
jgi:hypothetical protein